MAQSQVYTMLEDSRSYIWMGTWGGGLSRFDGKTFQSFTSQNGLVNNFILSLYEDHEQNIWIGTDNGLSKYNGLQFENFLTDQELNVYDITQDSLQRYYLATNKGVYCYADGNFEKHPHSKRLKDQKCYAALTDRKGQVWIGGASGALRLKGDEFETYQLPFGNIFCLEEDQQGQIWMGTYNGGVYVYDGTQLSPLNTDQGLASNLVQCIAEDADGLIWIGTQNKGVSIWNPSERSFSYLQKSNGLVNNDVRSILQDRWGNHWLGTSGDGVSKYFGQQFVHYDQSNGLVDDKVYAICQDTAQQIWFATGTRGVSVMDQTGNIINYDQAMGFVNNKSKAIFQDSKGRMWFGTNRSGLAMYDGTSFRFLTEAADGLIGKNIKDIVEDTLGHIWVATAGAGITRIRAIEQDSMATVFDCQRYFTGNGLPNNRINQLHFDRQARLWFATGDRGIGYLDPQGKIVSYGRKEGLPSNAIRSIEEDESGFLWIGTAGQGLCRVPIYADTFSVQHFNHKKSGLTSDNIYLLAFDQAQNLWVGNERGVDRVVLDVARNIKTIKAFSQADGFEGIETCQNAVMLDALGHLWFGTMNGLTQYIPGASKKNVIPPSLHIKQVRLFYEPIHEHEAYAKWAADWGSIKDSLSLPYYENHLSFEFLGINHANPEKVFYQWKLAGLETEYAPLQAKNTEVMYPNLSPGNYTFYLKSCNEDGVFNDSPVKIAFTIRPPFWQTWWFYLSAGLVISSLIFGIFRSRLNRIRRKSKADKERLEMEKNLLQLEQKALQLQMNPHFIFNALNSIQSLITKKDNQTARYQLAKFSKLMRAILENSRENNIPLEDEIQTLENYLAVEKFSRGNRFEYEFSVAEGLDPAHYLIPPMMIQPFVENAIIHGVAHRLEQGKIELRFRQQNYMLICEVLDNGIGRAAAQKIKSQQAAQHKSTALQVTQERLDILHQNKAIGKSLEISDRLNADGEIVGTKVILRLPLLAY